MSGAVICYHSVNDYFYLPSGLSGDKDDYLQFSFDYYDALSPARIDGHERTYPPCLKEVNPLKEVIQDDSERTVTESR